MEMGIGFEMGLEKGMDRQVPAVLLENGNAKQSVQHNNLSTF